MSQRHLVKSTILVAAFNILAVTVASICSIAYSVEGGRLYFVGVGPAGPELATQQALDLIKHADVIFTPNFIRKAFVDYLKGKDVRLGWPDSIYKVGNKPYTAMESKEERKQLGQAILKHAKELADQFKKEMKNGKSVAFLVNGDPCLYSDLRWLKKYFKEDEFEVIPGLSSFSVGAALFKVDLTQLSGLNTVVLNHPVKSSEVKSLAKHNATMVFFMAGNLKQLIRDLKKEYSGSTPIAVADFIGYPEKQKVTKGTLKTILTNMASLPNTDLRLVFVGDFMK
jgi:precorrin-4 methylase